MSSTTANTRGRSRLSEEEPLLGQPATRPGEPIDPLAASDDHSLAYNLVQGVAPLAQAGGLVLLLVVWASVFLKKKHQDKHGHDHGKVGEGIIVFDAHPMLNSLAILFAIEAILVLQPTGLGNMVRKRKAAYVHASFVALAAIAFFSALGIVIWHKNHSHIPHLEYIHSKFGLATYILIVLQALVGFTQLFIPQIYGGEENAKAMYKYHRIFGYAVILPMLLVTAILATKEPYAEDVLRIKTWAVVLAGVAIVAGIYPRIKISKLRGYRS